MDIQEYVKSDEKILGRAPVYDDPYALFLSGQNGEIVCTENRLLHRSGDDFQDLSIERIDSVQYRAPKMPRTYLVAGIVSLGFAILARSTYPNYTTLAFIVGPVLLATGYWLRTSVLTICTPSKTFTFKSRDESLIEIAQELRQREMGSE